MAYKLRILEIPLHKEYETTSVPFFYTEKQASFQYQLQYYRIQEYHVRDFTASQLLSGKKELKGKPVLPGGLNNHLCTWRTTLESQKALSLLKNEQNGLDQKNASAKSWNLAENWIKTIEKLGDNFAEIDGAQLVTDFLNYLRKYGLFDCRSASFTASRTLQFFYVLLDLVPQASGYCIGLITKHMEMLPGFGFLKPDEADSTLEELWKPALLSVLLEPDQSSTIFSGGLAYLDNRAIQAAIPDICLLVGDIHDPELFGFNHSEYVEKRLELYRKASKSPLCRDVAAFRCLSIITLLPEEFMTKITLEMTHKGIFDPSVMGSLPTEFPSMVAYTDFLIIKPLEDLSSVKHRLLSEIQTQEKGETIAGLEKLADTVSRHLQPGICRLFVKDSLSPVKVSLEMKEYAKAISHMIDLLKTKMPLDQMSELLQMVIDLLKGLRDSSPVCATEIEARRSVECFEVIKHRFLDYAIEKGHLQSSLYFLGKLYMETIDLKTGLNILMSGFLLVPASVSDLSFRRRTFKYLLFRSERANERETARQIISYIEEHVSEEATADELREKVTKMVIDWIEDRIMKQKYEGSNKEAFAESIKGETIRPSISYALSTIQKVLSGQQQPIKDHFADLEMALQDIFKPKSFFSKLSPLGLSGFAKSDDSGVPPEPKEAVLTVSDVRREISADPKLRLFAKECFEIAGSVGGLETFEYNGCNIYKGYFHSNQQKVTIFEVDYGDLFSPSIFKSVLTYLKIFHQHALCYYGVIVENGEAPGSIKIYYVGEHVDWFLSRASATHIEGLSDSYRAGVGTDILSCLASFHTAGIALCQLNPDLVAFSSGKAKVIFPFFLNSRLFFTNHYLGTRVTDDVMYPSLLFIKPEILRKPELLSGGGVSPFRKDFNQKFGPNMNGDLYSFTLIVAYLHLPRFFSRAEFTPSSSIQNYFMRTFTNSMRGAWAEELFEAANLAKLRPILTTLYKETTLPVNTFKLLAMFKAAWPESAAGVTPMSTRRSFVESLAFNTPQPLTSYAYFPCGIIADWPEEDPAMSRVYLQSNLLMLGPYWSAQETDSYQLELFSDDFESIKFEIIKGSISKAKLILKEMRGEQVAQRAKLQIDSFCANTFLPKRSVLEALMLPFKNVETPRSKDPLHAGLTSLRNFLAAADKLCTEIDSSQACLLDPFGNQVWTTFSETGFPELSGPVFIESYAAHNIGKSMVLIQDKHPGRWMSSRIGTFGLGETAEPWNKYVDLIRDFDCVNWPASMVLSPLGFVFNGSLNKGFLQRGVVIDPTKSTTTDVDAEDYAEQEVQLSGNLVYRGETCNQTPNGQGVLLRNNKQVYQGSFKDGLPHGKGKVSSCLDEQTAFTGYFRYGKPVYGTVIGKKKSCYGWIVSPPDGMEGGLAFSNHDTGLNSWLQGFSVESISPVLFALQTPEFTFEEMVLGDKLAFAPNAQYEGALEDKLPHGRGVLQLRGLGSLHGIFISKITGSDAHVVMQVKGNFIPEDKRVSASPLVGEFDLQPFQGTGNLGVQGCCSSRDGHFSGLLQTYLNQSGVLAVCWEQVSHQHGHGKRDSDNSSWVDLVKIEATSPSDNPVWEDWGPSEELRVYAPQTDIQIKQLSLCKFKEFSVLGKFRRLGYKSYEVAGPVELTRAEFKFELVLVDGQICGTMKAQDNKVLFSGFFDEHLQPKLGRLETFSPHRVASGHFSQLQLQEEGSLEHPNETVVVEGRFISGKKEGLAIAYVNKEKTLICSYQEDVRHGHALRLWPHGRQLMEFNYGDLSVVFEVEEFK